MTECNGCGCCCSPVVLSGSQRDYAEQFPGTIGAPETANRDWVLNDLTPIPTREGMQRARYLDHAITPLPGGQLVLSFFECRHFDALNRVCMNYENRPPICRGFPWFDNAPNEMQGLPLECEFRRDIGEVPVPFVRKP